MTLIIICLTVGGLLAATAMLVTRARRDRERAAIIDAAWQRITASASRQTIADSLHQRAGGQAAVNKAAADKLIPRFATRVKVTPLTAAQMRTPLVSMTLAHLYDDALPSKIVEVRRQPDGSWASVEDVTFANLPAATYTHLLIDNRLVPLTARQDGAPGGEGPM